MDDTIIISILSMTGLGLFFASVLALVNQKLKIKEPPRIEEIERALPGVNCGACGFTSCHLYAEAFARGGLSPELCKAGGETVGDRLSEILGIKAEKKVKEIVIVRCGAGASKRKKKATYLGVKTCQAAHDTFGGEVLCEYGCLGYGDCMSACPFGAIAMADGLPKIDIEKCTACGKCVTACARNLITVEKLDSKDFTYVACGNMDKGVETRRTCSAGCIACGVCRKLADGVFYVENNLAHARYDKIKDIDNTKEIVDKCPTGCIVSL